MEEKIFQSTPSTQRETLRESTEARKVKNISIHSLYAEGDDFGKTVFITREISIHSLYAEGDRFMVILIITDFHFNPLPLRRGRRRSSTLPAL